MNEYKQYNPFPDPYQILYGRPIDYKRLKKEIEEEENEDEVYSLALPHYMLILKTFPTKGYLIGVWATSKKAEHAYPDINTLSNVIVLEKNLTQMGLSDPTIIEFNARNINLMSYTDEFFIGKAKVKGKLSKNPIVGKLTPEYELAVENIITSHVQIQKIGSYLVKKPTQVLPLSLHDDPEYKLPTFELVYNYNKK